MQSEEQTSNIKEGLEAGGTRDSTRLWSMTKSKVRKECRCGLSHKEITIAASEKLHGLTSEATPARTHLKRTMEDKGTQRRNPTLIQLSPTIANWVIILLMYATLRLTLLHSKAIFNQPQWVPTATSTSRWSLSKDIGTPLMSYSLLLVKDTGPVTFVPPIWKNPGITKASKTSLCQSKTIQDH